MSEWMTVGDLCRQLKRGKTTVRKWIQLPGVIKEKRGRSWYVRSDSIDELLERGSHHRRVVRWVKREEDLKSQRCPSCQTDKWCRDGSSDLVSGDISAVLHCKNEECGRRWCVRFSTRAELEAEPPPSRKPKYWYLGDFRREDSQARVEADRRQYVEEMVDRDVCLWRVLEVFAPRLSREITTYFREAEKAKIERC